MAIDELALAPVYVGWGCLSTKVRRIILDFVPLPIRHPSNLKWILNTCTLRLPWVSSKSSFDNLHVSLSLSRIDFHYPYMLMIPVSVRYVRTCLLASAGKELPVLLLASKEPDPKEEEEDDDKFLERKPNHNQFKKIYCCKETDPNQILGFICMRKPPEP